MEIEEDFKKIVIKSEQLAFWYLRLNGFLTITNFVVHPDTGSNQRTDVDILAVRFPYRKELIDNSMEDDPIILSINRSKILIVIAEVKKGSCDLNGPWTDPKKRNMTRVMKAIGAFPESKNEKVASELYKQGYYENEIFTASLLCIGNNQNNILKKKYPLVKQILYPQILKFIYKRFSEYREQKSSHGQWDDVGKQLWDVQVGCKNDKEYIDCFEIK